MNYLSFNINSACVQIILDNFVPPLLLLLEDGADSPPESDFHVFAVIMLLPDQSCL